MTTRAGGSRPMVVEKKGERGGGTYFFRNSSSPVFISCLFGCVMPHSRAIGRLLLQLMTCTSGRWFWDHCISDLAQFCSCETHFACCVLDSSNQTQKLCIRHCLRVVNEQPFLCLSGRNSERNVLCQACKGAYTVL